MQTSAQESIVPQSPMLRGHTMDLKTLKTINDKKYHKERPQHARIRASHG